MVDPVEYQRELQNTEHEIFGNSKHTMPFLLKPTTMSPKIIAAAILGKYRERYGFTNIKYQEPLAYETVTVDGNIGIDVLAKCAKLSVSEFKAYNPHLLQHALPSGSKKYSIHVPKSTEFQPHWRRYLHQSESRINDTSSRKASPLDALQQNMVSLYKAFRPKTTLKMPIAFMWDKCS